MNDLELWERLKNIDDDEDLEGLAAMLHALCELAPHNRAPFLGFVDSLLGHSSGLIRGAAVSLLGGAKGHGGIERIVAALDDDDTDVRGLAVRALRKTSGTAPRRWAHAIFHPREDVRRLALETEAPRTMEFLGTYLRADPELRELARSSVWPKNPSSLVFDMFLRGHVDTIEAGDALANAPVPDLRSLLLHSVRRTLDFVGTSLSEFEGGTALPDEGRDVLDLWCRIYWACGEQREALSRKLAEAVFAKGVSLRTRAAFSLLRYGQLQGHVPETLQLAAACHPQLLLSKRLTLAERKTAVLGLRHHRDRLPRIRPALIEPLLASNLVGSGAAFDLTAAAILSSLVPGRGIAMLRDIAGDDALIGAAVNTPAAWTILAELPDDADGGPAWFIPKMRAVSSEAATGFIAAAAPHWLALSSAAKHNAKKNAPPTLLDRVIESLDSRAAADVLIRIATPPNSGGTKKQLAKLTELLSEVVDREDLGRVLTALLPAATDERPLEVLRDLLHHRDAAELVDALLNSDATTRSWFCAHAETVTLPRDTEMAIARALVDDDVPEVVVWADSVLSLLRRTVTTTTKRALGIRALSTSEKDAIATARDATLLGALAPAFASPSAGLCEALARRAPPAVASIQVCVALVASGDKLQDVAAQLDRFGDATHAFIEDLGPLAVELWENNPALPPLANALLHRWEKHGFALLAWIDGMRGGLAQALRLSTNLDEALARRILWEGISSVVLLRRYRQPTRIRVWCTAEVMSLLVEQLDTDVGVSAARMLAAFHLTAFATEHLGRLRERVVMLAPDMDAATRRELDRWIRIDGLGARATPARRRVAKLGEDRLAAIRTSSDLDWLLGACASTNEAIVHEATLRLIEIGAAGQNALAGLLADAPSETALVVAAASVCVWDDDGALERVRTLARTGTTPAQNRFRIAVALHMLPETGWGVVALAAVAAPSPAVWLTKQDWDLLVKLLPEERTLYTALAGSMHPHAYQRAVMWLLENGGDDDPSLSALRVFLRAGIHRPRYLRHAAAQRLLEQGDRSGIVVCLGHVFGDNEESFRWLYDGAGGRSQRNAVVQHALDAALLGGPDFCSEERCLTLVRSKAVETDTRNEALQRILLHGQDAKAREALVAEVSRGSLRDAKLGQVSELFAWGVRKGRELTGRFFSVHMTDRRQDLGYTRMTENTIYVSPLPLMRGDRHGKDVVEALILHEYGHHLYHRDLESQRIWKRAVKEGLGNLLNLVADEHLERRLRAVDATYGDRLKRLAAYAFQHTNRELEVQNLLNMLQSSALEALSARPLGVAFEDSSVVVDSGLVLRELDRRGHPFARFVRAMRMGLGNRHDDPLLARALSLFKGGFRHKDMRGLYEIAIELSLMHGSQSDLAEAYGGHESLEWGERDGSVHGSGIGDADVQQEVERILKPPSASATSSKSGRRGSLQINVGADAAFGEINKVERVKPDRDRHRQLAVEVRRYAFRLRTYFEEIGLALVPRRGRLRGRAFDRTRLKAVVTRRDPRMLVARELEVHTDLFIGVVIDCSGSMSVGGSMEKAHRFGVLLAEAARGLAGVDARFFGFTDRVVYDAGDENNCAVTSLDPGGGNNDAAGLLHAASVAAASRRKAKILIMISDGLPTECSVQALRNLVEQLTRRRGIVCAQVAVRSLDEVCFPHYIELLDPELDRAVRRFGEIISGLARRALGR